MDPFLSRRALKRSRRGEGGSRRADASPSAKLRLRVRPSFSRRRARKELKTNTIATRLDTAEKACSYNNAEPAANQASSSTSSSSIAPIVPSSWIIEMYCNSDVSDVPRRRRRLKGVHRIPLRDEVLGRLHPSDRERHALVVVGSQSERSIEATSRGLHHKALAMVLRRLRSKRTRSPIADFLPRTNLASFASLRRGVSERAKEQGEREPT